jgi:hydrogenase maturation protein HypF
LNWTCERPWAGCPAGDDLAKAAWSRELNSPETSAAGRLFDAAAAMIGRFHYATFEAQGPMYLESLVRGAGPVTELPITRDDEGIWRTDWEPLLDTMCDDQSSHKLRAEGFHSSLAQALLRQAQKVREEHAIDQVGLCGGVFQNRVLTEQVVDSLGNDGFEVCVPIALPCNDAALSFGQAAELAARAGRE